MIYIGTFSKCALSGGARIGYLVIPPDLVGRFSAVRAAMDICPPGLNQAVLADFIAEGHFARATCGAPRAIYAERRGAMVEALHRELGPRLEVVGAQAGIHLTAILAEGAEDRAISERAARDGLWVMALSSRYLGPPTRQGLVLGYGGTSVEQIPDAVRRLRRIMSAS